MSTTSYDSLWRLNVCNQIVLPDGTVQDVILRSIGREDAKARRDFAREQANLARKSLLDTESDEYAEFIAPAYEATDEELEKVVRQWFKQILASEAKEEIILVEDSEDAEQPSTLVESLEKEEEEKSQAEFVEEERKRYISANIDKRVAAVVGDREAMMKLVVRVLTESHCLSVHDAAWDDATLYYGVIKPDGSKFFSDMPVNSPEELVSVLRDMYREVDEGSYRPSS